MRYLYFDDSGNCSEFSSLQSSRQSCPMVTNTSFQVLGHSPAGFASPVSSSFSSEFLAPGGSLFTALVASISISFIFSRK